jgi:hypothetical protein
MSKESLGRESGQTGPFSENYGDLNDRSTPNLPKKRSASVDRHKRKCTICRHPEREAIEQDYLEWRSPEAIARDYGIADHSSVYRHIHATGLRHKRLSPVRAALESIIERAADAKNITGDTIVRAVWAYAHINDSGQWIDPPKTTKIIRYESPDSTNSNRQPCRTETSQPAENKGGH